MNEVLRRRLVGLAVLLFGLFVLSWFVPGGDGRGVEPGTPSTVVALGPGGAVETPDATAAPDEAPPASASAAAVPAGPAAPPIADLTGDARPVPEPSPAAVAAAQTPGPAAKPASGSPAGAEAVPKHAPVPVAKLQPEKAAAAKPAHEKLAEKAAEKTAAKPAPKPAAKPAAKPAPSPSAAAEKSVAAQPGWWIQIGSYADRSKAETILSLLRKVGHRGELSTVQGQKSLLNRVRLGPYPNEAAARAALPKVAHQGYPQARVVSEPSAH